MRFFKNPQEINQFISHKKTIEQLLALELLDEFNKGDLINGVRAVAHGALDVIMDAPENVILSTFKRFENRKDNKLILIYYEKGKPAGCFQFEEAEKREFQKIATADISLWQYFASIGPYSTEADILKLLRQYGLEGKALQAVRKGFRR